MGFKAQEMEERKDRKKPIEEIGIKSFIKNGNGQNSTTMKIKCQEGKKKEQR